MSVSVEIILPKNENVTHTLIRVLVVLRLTTSHSNPAIGVPGGGR